MRSARTAPFDLDEARLVVEDWVELAIGLSPAELRTLDMLILMQEGNRNPKPAERKVA